MDFLYEQDGLLTIDIDELGVRPLDWIDIDETINDFNTTEKTIDFTVYSAELQFTDVGKKLTTNEDDSSMSDDENSYDIDPETGEKIFRESTLISNTSSPPTSNDVRYLCLFQWIEEFLSKIETSSHQTLPITTTDNSELILDNIPTSFFDTIDDQTDSDWFSNLLDLNENSDNTMFTNPNQFIDNNENTSNEITTISSSLSSPNIIPLSNENITTNNESTLINPLSILVDDEYSNYSEISYDDTKLEKNESDDDSISHMIQKRTNARLNNQRQQDEDALRQFNIPLTVNDITQSSTEEYNRHLAGLTNLTSQQMHIIKDIRRRGKNKIAAQNCRKRKAIGVEFLSEEVDELKRVKHELEERKKAILQQIADTRRQYEYLHQQVLPDRQLPPVIIVK
ncbi:unnamed protein product [Rotaria sordida]|uniref:BZIP domain-containing protein n=1 Tax=Rotaria sordida TaxID=392033 RepID=A0A814D873_9BILA|nr:unnamed protein product [Rotaria sordida]